MLNNYVISFYDNFGSIFKGLVSKATNGIENWLLLTNPLLIVASSCQSHKPDIARNYSLWRTSLLLRVWKYLHSFSHNSLQKRDKKI